MAIDLDDPIALMLAAAASSLTTTSEVASTASFMSPDEPLSATRTGATAIRPSASQVRRRQIPA